MGRFCFGGGVKVDRLFCQIQFCFLEVTFSFLRYKLLSIKLSKMKTVLKKLLLGAFIVSSIFGIYSFKNPKNGGDRSSKIEECTTCRYDQCHATAKSTGQRCKHCVSSYGDFYCYQHK